MADDPYSRLYWRVLDEFPDVFEDDEAFGMWCRLLIIADQAWPSAAYLPGGLRRRTLDTLTTAGVLIVTGRKYRVRGMDKHRQARSDAARNAVAKRWDNGRTTDVGTP